MSGDVRGWEIGIDSNRDFSTAYESQYAIYTSDAPTYPTQRQRQHFSRLTPETPLEPSPDRRVSEKS